MDKCRTQIHEIRNVNVDNLLYVKEDLIIPHVCYNIKICNYIFLINFIEESKNKNNNNTSNSNSNSNLIII